MKNFYVALLMLFMGVSCICCKTQKPVGAETTRDTVENKITVTEVVRDTTVVLQQDSSLANALIECDSNGKALVKMFYEYRSGRSLQPPSIVVKDNVLTAKCKIDSQSVYLTWKEKNIKEESRQSTIVEKTITQKENHLTGWQWFQVWVGRIGLLMILLTLIVFFIKRAS